MEVRCAKNRCRLAACAPQNLHIQSSALASEALHAYLAITSRNMSKRNGSHILAADHTGITVSNLDKSLAFWRDVLGFELSHTAHQTGEMAREITGVAGAEIKLAVVKAPGGHKIELLEYLAPAERKRQVRLRPCDLGSVHVALIVDDLDAILSAVNASGWKAAGKPQTLQSGPNAGKRVVYVRDPDGTTIEFMQQPGTR
jgi:catechol 2,3-dioxygenase-like lactoylglutathione lyase family enzyme